MGVFENSDRHDTKVEAASSDLYNATMREVPQTPEQRKFADLLAANEAAIKAVITPFINIFDKLDPAMRSEMLSQFPKGKDQPLYAALSQHYA